MRTILILNPTSGSSPLAVHQGTIDDHQELILASLRTHNIQPEIWFTTAEDPGKKMAHRATEEGADLVIAAGGDGTIHTVASGLIGTDSTLGIIPMGTMNNIARSLEIPEDIERACEIIAKGTTSQVDVGKMNEHVFLEVTGIGLEAALFPAAEEIKSRGFLSTIHGVFKGLMTLFDFQPTRFTVSFDGKKVRHFRAVQISVCNSPYYGARLQFAPDAMMDDGLLDVLIYRNFSKLEYMRHAISISQGRRALEPEVSHRKVKSIHISAEHPVEIHVDGEQKGHTPATITIQPGVLHVRVPEHIAAKHMTSTQKKQTQPDQQTQRNEIAEEKGPLHVQ